MKDLQVYHAYFWQAYLASYLAKSGLTMMHDVS